VSDKISIERLRDNKGRHHVPIDIYEHELAALVEVAELAQAGRRSWEKTVAKNAPHRDPWATDMASTESRELVTALDHFHFGDED
jgi:hypothetical protein